MELSLKITDLPFNRFIGIDKSGENISLTKHDRLLNHVGTLHASALYGLAEAAWTKHTNDFGPNS